MACGRAGSTVGRGGKLWAPARLPERKVQVPGVYTQEKLQAVGSQGCGCESRTPHFETARRHTPKPGNLRLHRRLRNYAWDHLAAILIYALRIVCSSRQPVQPSPAYRRYNTTFFAGMPRSRSKSKDALLRELKKFGIREGNRWSLELDARNPTSFESYSFKQSPRACLVAQAVWPVMTA